MRGEKTDSYFFYQFIRINYYHFTMISMGLNSEKILLQYGMIIMLYFHSLLLSFYFLKRVPKIEDIYYEQHLVTPR